jgi:hypothetical protein
VQFTVNDGNGENEERASTELSGEEDSNAVLFPKPLLLLADVTKAERKAACVPKEFVSLQGFVPIPENNLRTKPPKYHGVPTQKTQEKARKQSSATYLKKSAGWRFESSPVHHSSIKTYFVSHLSLFSLSVGTFVGSPPQNSPFSDLSTERRRYESRMWIRILQERMDKAR